MSTRLPAVVKSGNVCTVAGVVSRLVTKRNLVVMAAALASEVPHMVVRRGAPWAKNAHARFFLQSSADVWRYVYSMLAGNCGCHLLARQWSRQIGG